MNHREARLKSALFKQLRTDAPSFLVLQLATAGAPDREVVGNKCTTYWECKHGTPRFVSHGNQQLICQRLDMQAFCRYVLWINIAGEPYTFIVKPSDIERFTPGSDAYEETFIGYNHKAVSNYILNVHGVL